MANDMLRFWILDGHTPKQVSMPEWVEWNGLVSKPALSHRSVAQDAIGEVRVSTVFLIAPVLDQFFETMVFGGTLDREQVRYATWDEAVAGHAEMIAKVKNG